MQTETKQFENWITNKSGLSEQDVTTTRRVLEIMYASKLYLTEHGIRAKVGDLIDITRMAMEEGKREPTCEDT